MLFCPKCGIETPEDSRFCYKCGNEISGDINDDASEKINEDLDEASQKEKEDILKTVNIIRLLVSFISICTSLVVAFNLMSEGLSELKVIALLCTFLAGVIILFAQRRKTAKMRGTGMIIAALLYVAGGIISLNYSNLIIFTYINMILAFVILVLDPEIKSK